MKLTIRKREILSDGLIGLGGIIAGILSFRNADIVSVVVITLVLMGSLTGLLIAKRKINEPWDEMTKMNYANARKQTLWLIISAIIGISCFMILTKATFTIKAGHMMITYGFIIIIQLVFFLIEEKRG